MFRKVYPFIFVSLTIMAINSFGAIFTNGAPSDNNWNTPGNWDTGLVPANDRVYIPGDSAGAVGPLINSDVNDGTARIDVGSTVGSSTTAKLTITGGTVTAGRVYLGESSPGQVDFSNATWNNSSAPQTWYIGGRNMAGVMNMSSGTVYMEDLFVPWRTGGTTGRLNMTGGIIYITDDFKLDGIGTVNLDGGKIEQIGTPFGYDTSANGEFLVGYGCTLNITGGKLILNGDARDAIDGCVNVLGIPTGYGDPDKIHWDYDKTVPGKTVIWAETTPRKDYYSEVKVFSDNFGTDAFDKSQWTYSGPSSTSDRWEGVTDVPAGTSGYSCRLMSNSATRTLTMTNGVDATGAFEVFVDFWVKLTLNSNTIGVYFNSSSAPTTFTLYKNLSNITIGQWTHYTAILKDPKYMFNGLQMRFSGSTASGTGSRYAWFDEVIIKARTSTEPTKANDPIPADGATYQVAPLQLSWGTGYLSVLHDVYFGTDFDEVSTANNSSQVCVGKNQTDNTFTISTLEYGKTYYWRVDEHYQGAHPDFGGTGVLKGDVWSFSSLPQAPQDPNLLGWWQFEDIGNAQALDSSGYGHKGTFSGNAAIVSDSEHGYVLSLDGAGDFVNLGNGAWTNPGNHLSLLAWIKVGTFDVANQTIVAKGLDTYRLSRSDSANTISAYMNDTASTYKEVAGSTNVNDGLWHHTAMVYDGSVIKLYVDGVQEGSSVPLSALNTTTASLMIGRNSASTGRDWQGFIDDVRIYNRVVSASEIQTMFATAWPYARSPYPANATEPFRDHNPTLTWVAGQEAIKHDVYFGTNQTAIENATPTQSWNTYKGQQSTTSYKPAGPLAYGKTYYWRIDEVNDLNPQSPWKGSVWWFRMRNFNILDDMEDYNDITKPINGPGGWRDNSYNSLPGGHCYIGKLADGEPAQGIQSLKFYYDSWDWGHNQYYNSECVKILDTPQDWSFSGSGLAMLYLRIYGEADNGADKFYVALEDASGHNYTIYHPDTNVLLNVSWQTWKIPLSNFTGVDLTKVKKIYLGCHQRYSEVYTDVQVAGTIYIDDIRLYPPTCNPDMAKPAADLNNDCVVNLSDIQIMANHWLDKDIVIKPETVSSNNLEGCWNFDNGNASDTSGKGRNGFEVGTVEYVYDAARGSKVLTLVNDGTTVNDINCGGNGEVWASGNDITVSCWAKIQAFTTNLQKLVNKPGSWVFERNALTDTMKVQLNGVQGSLNGGITTVPGGNWHHVAFTYSSTANVRALYIDGALDKSVSSTTPNALLTTGNLIIGGDWNGQIDDVRIYSRVLSRGEILTLAGKTTDFVIPVDPAVNLSAKGVPGQEIINDKDFSKLAVTWLQEILWP